MGSKVIRAVVWQRTDLPPDSNMHGLKSDSCSCLAAAAAHVGESNSRSNVFQIPRASVCVPSRWKVLSDEFRRRPTEFAIKIQNLDRVGRRGLSEPREDFSRLPTKCCSIPWLDSVVRIRRSILASPRNQNEPHNPTVCQTVFTSVTA
jgi:hypothetical protein